MIFELHKTDFKEPVVSDTPENDALDRSEPEVQFTTAIVNGQVLIMFEANLLCNQNCVLF